MKAVKKKLTNAERTAILDLARKGKGIVEIARALDIRSQVVGGVVTTARNMGLLLAAPPGGLALTAQTHEEKLQALSKNWQRTEPNAEFSLNMGDGQRLYMAAYKEGLVVRIGKDKNVILLTPPMAVRVSAKIGEMINWCQISR